MGSGVELFITSSQRYHVIGRNALSCGMLVAMHSTLLLDAFKIKRNKDSASFLHLEKGLHGTPQTIFHLYAVISNQSFSRDFARLHTTTAHWQGTGSATRVLQRQTHFFNEFHNFHISQFFPFSMPLGAPQRWCHMKGVPRPLTFAAAILRY